MLENIYNAKNANKTNYVIIILLCLFSYLHLLRMHIHTNGIEIIKPLFIIAIGLALVLIKTQYSQLKAVALCILPSLGAFIILDANCFLGSFIYMLIVSLLMAAMYIKQEIILKYAVVQNLLIILLLLLIKGHVSEDSRDYLFDCLSGLLVFNVLSFLVYIISKSANNLIDKYSNSYLEMSVLRTELSERDNQLQSKSNELNLKDMEIGSLYNQVEASEQELKSQYSEIEKKQEEIQKNNKILAIIGEICNDWIWYFDTKNNTKIHSPSWYKKLGYNNNEIISLSEYKQIIHPDDCEIPTRFLEDSIKNKTGRFKCQYRIKNKQGEYIWVEEVGKVIYDKDGEASLVVGADTDITKDKKQNEKIEHLAYHDVLTGLPNRICFYEKLKVVIEQAEANNKKFSLIIMDIDNFKMINDSLGHGIGDEVLKRISGCITKAAKSKDIVSRFGGDSFSIVLNEVEDITNTTEFVENIMRVLTNPFEVFGKEINVRGSIGVANYPEDGTTSEELLKNSDTALNKVKANGKNAYQFFNNSMKNDMLQKIDTEGKLRKAIKRKDFVLYFQPQVDIATGKIRGFEALIRWLDGNNLIYPDKFISIAEETGLIVELGDWILLEACRKGTEWIKLYDADVIISVNISVVQLKHSDFVNSVKKVLEITGLKPRCLELEITESMFIGSFEESVSKLNDLRQLGIKIALDDFGTGYSSLNYLKNLPIDTLKIDKTFIDGISDVESGKEIVASIIKLVQSLKLDTIAEGVETKEQLLYLTENGCDNVQGYIFSKPVPETEVVNKLFMDYNNMF